MPASASKATISESRLKNMLQQQVITQNTGMTMPCSPALLCRIKTCRRGEGKLYPWGSCALSANQLALQVSSSTMQHVSTLGSVLLGLICVAGLLQSQISACKHGTCNRQMVLLHLHSDMRDSRNKQENTCQCNTDNLPLILEKHEKDYI